LREQRLEGARDLRARRLELGAGRSPALRDLPAVGGEQRLLARRIAAAREVRPVELVRPGELLLSRREVAHQELELAAREAHLQFLGGREVRGDGPLEGRARRLLAGERLGSLAQLRAQDLDARQRLVLEERRAERRAARVDAQ